MLRALYLFVIFVLSCKSIPQLKMPNDGPSISNSGNPFPAYRSEPSTQAYLFSSSARALRASLLSGLPMFSAITGPCSHFRQYGQCGGQHVVKKDITAERNGDRGERTCGNCIPGLLYAPWWLDCRRMSRPYLLGGVGACWRSSRWSLWLLGP